MNQFELGGTPVFLGKSAETFENKEDRILQDAKNDKRVRKSLKGMELGAKVPCFAGN